MILGDRSYSSCSGSAPSQYKLTDNQLSLYQKLTFLYDLNWHCYTVKRVGGCLFA